MNKRFTYLIVALMCLLCGQTALAQTTFTIGDLTYYHDGGYGNSVQVRAANTSISGEITIPAEVQYNDQTWSVEYIAARGFKDCQRIKSVVINANIREILDEAFEKCYYMESISLPSTLEQIHFGAFYDCTSLKSLTIPSRVWIIKRAAFHNTTALKNVVIEDAESEIQFWNGSENYNYGTAHMFNSVLDKIYIGRSIWTETSGKITTSAREIETAGSFGDIPADFTNDNLYLTKVTLGGNIYSIGDKAFYHCDNLVDVSITADVRFIGTDAFCRTGITNIELPENLETIGYGVFYNCNKLESITIPSSVWAIHRAAFYGTDALKNVVVEDGESPIFFYNDNYDYNFGNANLFDSEIDKIYIGREIGFAVSGKLALNAEEVEFGGHFGDVPAQLFKNGGVNNYRLKKVTIGGVGTSIGDEAFFHCSNLAEINITAPIQWIGIDAFCRANKLTSITFPQTVTNLSHGVVQNCEMLEYVFIPKSVTEIGRSVFLGCPLKEVAIEDGAEPIVIHNSQYYDGYTYGDNNIFSSDVLQKIHVGRNIQMDEGKFVTHADEIELGISVTSIDNLFSNTTGTTRVTAPWATPVEIEADDFTSDVKTNALLLIPRGTAEAYTTAGWNFSNIGYDQYEVTLTTTAGGNVKIGDLVATTADNNKAQLIDRESDVVVEVEKEQDYDFTSLAVNSQIVEVVDGKYTIENIVEDKEIVATFTEKPKFNISAEAGEGGMVNVQDGIYHQSSDANIYRDRDAVVGIKCNDNYEIVSVVLDKEDVTEQVVDGFLTIPNIQGAHQVNVTFRKINLEVIFTTTTGGTIIINDDQVADCDKSRVATVSRGSDVTLDIIPDDDYDFKEVKSDDLVIFTNETRGTVTYTLENVQEDQTITVVFTEKPLLTITASATNGTVTPTEQQVHRDRNAVVTLTPDEGHYLSALTVNGNDAKGMVADNTLTISNVQDDQVVVAAFTKYVYNVTAAPAINGTVELAATSVEWGGNTTATITPAEGYMIEHVYINNVMADDYLDGNTLSINDVKQNTEVSASFRILSYRVTITGEGVTADNMYPQHGDQITITVVEDPDRELTSLKINGVENKGGMVGNTLTITVTENINVVAEFKSTVEVVTLKNAHTTLCCNQDLNFTGSDLKAYVVVGCKNNNDGSFSVLLSRVFSVPAGTGLYLIGEKDATYKIPYSASNSYYMNMLVGNCSGASVAYNDVVDGKRNYYFNGTEFKYFTGQRNISDKKAYLQVPLSFYDPTEYNAKINVVIEEDMTDSIEDYIMLNQRGNDRIFNLNGQQVDNAGKGVYIINGKKVANK